VEPAESRPVLMLVREVSDERVKEIPLRPVAPKRRRVNVTTSQVVAFLSTAAGVGCGVSLLALKFWKLLH